MRIAFALPSLHLMARGAEVAFDAIGEALARAGHEATLIGGGPAPADRSYDYLQIPYELPASTGPSVAGLPLRQLRSEVAFARRLSKALDDGHFDATVACTFPMVHLACRRQRRRGGAAHIWVTQTGDWPARAKHVTSRLRSMHYGLFECDGLVCVNPEHYEANREHYHAALIPNGVDLDDFAPGSRAAARRARGFWDDDRDVALMVSSLHRYKRVLEAIDAVAEVDGLSLIVAGSGPMEAEIRAHAARRLGPDRFRITYLPPSDMPDVYRAADLLLHMSLDEPFGIAYVEALATGLPVVADDNRRSQWILGDVAHLCDTRNQEATVAQLRAALQARSPEAARQRRERASRFEWSELAEQYASFIASCVAHRSDRVASGSSD